MKLQIRLDRIIIFLLLSSCALYANIGNHFNQSNSLDLDALPKTPKDFEINFFVKEPHIINPAALCFDAKGRLYVGAGPQYRAPKPDSPTDYIKILIDDDEDGVAETVKTFAKGLNCIQSMAWRGDELWVANSPELTVLRDTDGDDVADEYKVVYTGLNNLRHGLHGLSWGPDGWLYMTLGNTWVKRNAPKPIRDLQGIRSKDQTQYPLTKVYSEKDYPKSYHPMNKSEREGGMFRCRPGGYDLELYARGMRNPWDACFDAEFNWLATDNDPGQPGERVFMPLQYAHYSMKHPWKYDWMGTSLAIAPSSYKFPRVSGSGTGVEYYMSDHFPKAYQNQYLICDWTNNRVFFYKPKWQGALQVPDGEVVDLITGSGTAGDLKYKGGKGVSLFRPTDLKVGPAGEVYVAGWGSAYGTVYVPADQWTEEENAKYQGRVFRVRHKNKLLKRSHWFGVKRKKPLSEWTYNELLEDLASHLEVWRVNAQLELIRRGPRVRKALHASLASGKLNASQETWVVWALGLIEHKAKNIKDFFPYAINQAKLSVNIQVQALRVLGDIKAVDAIHLLISMLEHSEPRVRLAALQSLEKTGFAGKENLFLDAMANEKDRVTLYTAWQVLRRHRSEDQFRIDLQDKRSGVRLMAMLSLMETRKAKGSDIKALLGDEDLRIKKLANDWLRNMGYIKRVPIHMGYDDVIFRESNQVSLHTPKPYVIRYTLDGSELSVRAKRYAKPILINESVSLKAAAFYRGKIVSDVIQKDFQKISDEEWMNRLVIHQAKLDQTHLMVLHEGFQRGVKAYSRDPEGLTVVDTPKFIEGASMLRLPKKLRSKNMDLSFRLNVAAELYLALPVQSKRPAWLSGFELLDEKIKCSNDLAYDIYQKKISPGKTQLSMKSHFQIKYPPLIFMTKQGMSQTSVKASILALKQANEKRGKEIFFGRGTCFACHKVGDKGVKLGPDLDGIAARRDMKYVIESIIRPSEYIVEGYQQTSIQTINGSKYFGMIQEDTEQSVVLFLANGEKVVLRTKDIKSRQDAKVSGMPSSFEYTLSPQDVADLSTWIMKLGKGNDTTSKR